MRDYSLRASTCKAESNRHKKTPGAAPLEALHQTLITLSDAQNYFDLKISATQSKPPLRTL